MRALSVADILVIAEAVLEIDTDRLGYAVNLGLADSALAAPFAGFGTTEVYPEPAMKAAILCSRIIRNHPLPDGNKRVGYLAMREFLARNGYAWIRPADDEIVEMIERLAARNVTEAEFAQWVAQHVS